MPDLRRTGLSKFLQQSLVKFLFVIYATEEPLEKPKYLREAEYAREGDWFCGACSHLNFSKRTSCRECGISREVGLIIWNNESIYG